MKTVWFVYHVGDDCGEVEGMFEVDGTLISWWSCNDAMWREEYFNHFLFKLGIQISSKVPKKILAACIAQLEELGSQ